MNLMEDTCVAVAEVCVNAEGSLHFRLIDSKVGPIGRLSEEWSEYWGAFYLTRLPQ